MTANLLGKEVFYAFEDGAKAYYYLGNLYYDKLQYEKAVRLWEKSVELDDMYPTVHRNLALAYYNKKGDADRAKRELEKAFELDPSDAKVFLELDQLYKKLGTDFETRLEKYEKYPEFSKQRDDVMIEYVTLYNLTGQYEKAYDLIMSHEFRPWEGAEGKEIRTIENHPESKESFEPLHGMTVLLVAEHETPEEYHAFILDKPVCLKKGIWHQVLALTPEASVKITENLEVKSVFYEYDVSKKIMMI